ncbi:MAG: GDP-mannose 4,6-dehydratase [Melioribacteraceae bacterium]|nr:GDP-mannose 4,6-dehydratase [Melioribacteraceae bacterium]
MNFLITGAAGFIGSHLADRLLSLNHQVIAVDNFDPFYSRRIKEQNISGALSSKNYKLDETDILDNSGIENIFQVQKIDLVIHLAAKAGVRPSIEDPIGYYNTNVIGTLNILEAMKKNGCNKMIFASSSSVYGNNKKVPFSETDSVDNPISPYAATKKAAELLCHTYHHLYNFDIFALRFFTVYGPRQRPDLAIHKFAKLIMNDQPLPFHGDGSTSRDYTYIDDTIDGIIGAIDNLKGFEVINLGENKTITLNELVESLENLLNKKAKLIKLPLPAGDVNRTFADIKKAKNKINYSPKYDLVEGLDNFITWMKNRNG